MAATAPEAPRALHIEVDPAVDDAAMIPQWFAAKSLEVDNTLLQGPGQTRSIQVSIGGRYLDYHYRVVAIRDGRQLGRPQTNDCKCSTEELVAQVGLEIDVAVAVARDPQSTVFVVPPPRLPIADASAPDTGASDGATMQRVSQLGRAGLGVGLGGTVIAITGAILAGIPARATTKYQHLERDYQRPSIGLIATGAVFAAAGFAVFSVEFIKCNRKTASLRPARCAGQQLSLHQRTARLPSPAGRL